MNDGPIIFGFLLGIAIGAMVSGALCFEAGRPNTLKDGRIVYEQQVYVLEGR
jgi:hypothetical protein